MKKWINWLKIRAASLLLLMIPITICILEINSIHFYPVADNMENFRELQVDPDYLSKLSDRYEWGTDEFFDTLTVQMIKTIGMPEIKKEQSAFLPIHFGLLRNVYIKYKKIYKILLSDIQCFPVAEDEYGGVKVTFEDTWGEVRTYGGERKHEGTDIMAGNNKRGYFPVVSMTDGTVEKKGWLSQGGWRLGIRSPSGAYFYYAHLYDYADGIEEGTQVEAGEFIGFMGDSGYGEEGTVGQFDVHLHVGIYFDNKGQEESVNPYYVLKYYENKKRKFYNKSN